MSVKEQLKIIEQNHLSHFAFLPKKLGFSVGEINGVTVISCGLQSSMFNIAYGAPRDSSDSNSIIKVKEAFSGGPFAWWIPQSQHNPDLTKSLLNKGLIIEAAEHAMICDLGDIIASEQKIALLIKPVTNALLLQDFIRVLEPYDSSVRNFYEQLNDEQLQSQEKLFVGYQGDQPVTIGILFVLGKAAGIFSLLTNDETRGKGFGTEMMRFLINTAKEIGCKFLTLSASSDSGYRIYERLGFCKIGEFECFEYKKN